MSFRQLFIPRKGSTKARDIDTNWREIEIWAQQFPLPSSAPVPTQITIPTPITAGTVLSLAMGSDSIWVAGGLNFGHPATSNTVMVTTNAGRSWNGTDPSGGALAKAVNVSIDAAGVILATLTPSVFSSWPSGAMYSSADYGLTWSTVSFSGAPAGAVPVASTFYQGTSWAVLMTTGNDAYVAISTNSGATWSYTNVSGANNWFTNWASANVLPTFWGIQTLGADLYAWADSGYVAVSTNGGSSWTQSYPFNFSASGVSLPSGNAWLASQSGVSLGPSHDYFEETANQGTTWTAQGKPFAGHSPSALGINNLGSRLVLGVGVASFDSGSISGPTVAYADLPWAGSGGVNLISTSVLPASANGKGCFACAAYDKVWLFGGGVASGAPLYAFTSV